MSAADWLAERARIEQAASEGPWEINGAGEYVSGVGLMVAPDDGGVSGTNAEFIADARTAMPKMRAALEAVLKLHEPVAVYAQADECECGNEDHTIIESEQGDDLCWDTPTGEQRCGECLDEDGGYIDYPCPTVVLIREALT